MSLLDIKMPKINGFELYQKLKEIDEKAKIYFITASEIFYEEYRTGAVGGYLSIDKEYFIQKPFKIDDFIKRLNTTKLC